MSLETISHYRILTKLGEGGMGEVYLAEDTRLDRKVAVKLLPAAFTQDADRVRRFMQEAKAASALNHPNIITVHDIGETQTGRFIVMELVAGRTLRTIIAENNSTTEDAADARRNETLLSLGSQIAKALSAAHAAGITHRDIKPDNIMVREDGYLKILDFGLARLLPTAANYSEAGTLAQQTTPGTLMGTVAYMSPEQASGRIVNHPSDVFSLGIVLYELATGRHPFKAETLVGYLHAITLQSPAPPTGLRPELPAALDALILRMLDKEASRRPTASEVAQALQEISRHGTTSTQDGTARPVSEFRKHKRSVAALLVLLLAAVSGVGYWFSSVPSSGSADAIDSIAVLPFQNKSADSDTEYLSDGLAESLIYRLSQLPKLKVSPTSSVFRYKGKETDPIRVGTELGVNAVISGRMVQRGDNLTISVELVDVRNNKTLWGEQYERKLADLLGIQREMATEITQKLQLKLSGEDKRGLNKRYTDNNEAYQLYLKGRYHFAKRTRDDILRGIGYFKQAISLDPNYALAHAAIADSYNAMPPYAYLSPKEANPQAKAAATRALEIDPTLAEAHTALANSLAVYDWNWVEAEREFKRALELNPNDSGTHWRYGMFYLMPMGRLDEAIAELKRALEQEPLSLNHGANLSGAYFYARQYDRALDQAKTTYGLEPNFVLGRWALSQAYIVNGMYEDAIALSEKALQTDPTNQAFLRFAGYANAKSGRRREAEEVIKKFKDIAKAQYVMSSRVAVIHVALGQKEKAFAELEESFADRDWELHRLKIDPFMDPLRADPRFKDLVRRMNLPE